MVTHAARSCQRNSLDLWAVAPGGAHGAAIVAAEEHDRADDSVPDERAGVVRRGCGLGRQLRPIHAVPGPGAVAPGLPVVAPELDHHLANRVIGQTSIVAGAGGMWRELLLPVGTIVLPGFVHGEAKTVQTAKHHRDLAGRVVGYALAA